MSLRDNQAISRQNSACVIVAPRQLSPRRDRQNGYPSCRCLPIQIVALHKNLIARGKRVYLVVPEGDTKNNEPVDFELPAETVDIVAWYIRDYRPHLVRAPTDALFPGEGSGPKAAYLDSDHRSRRRSFGSPV